MSHFHKLSSFLLCFIFSISGSFVSAENEDATKRLDRLRGSNLAMLELMDIDEVRLAYREMQYSLLNVPTDSGLLNLFEADPILAQVIDRLAEAQEEISSDFIHSQFNNAVIVEQDFPGELGRLDNMIVDVLVSLGFTRAAIQNRKIYAVDGPANAFTVSGSEMVPIISVNRGLLTNMTDKEEMSVMGHEAGHILSKHVIISMVSRILLQVTGTYMTTGQSGLMNLRASATMGHSLTDQLKGLRACSNPAHNHHHEHANFELVPAGTSGWIGRVNFTPTDGEIALNNIVSSVFRLPATQLINMSLQFFDYILKNNSALGLSQETVSYIANLMNQIQRQQKNGGEMFDNPQNFSAHAEAVLNAISRVKESSADNYAGSVMPNQYVASAFMKLLWPNFTTEERDFFFKKVQAQREAFFKTVDPKDWHRYMGTTHPALVLRVYNILDISKFPSVAIANPFMRLILIRDHVDMLAGQSFYNAKALEAELAAGIPDEVKQQFTEEQIAQMIDQAETQQLLLLEKGDNFKAATPLVEDRIISEILELSERRRNPRLEDYMQLRSYQKRLMFAEADRLEATLPTIEDTAQKQQVIVQIKQLRDYAKQNNAFTTKLYEAYKAKHLKTNYASDKIRSAQVNYLALFREMVAVDSVDADEILRRKIYDLTEGRTGLKRTELPIDLKRSCELLLKASS